VARVRDAVKEPCLQDFDMEGWLWGDLTAQGRRVLQGLLERSLQTELTERLGYAPYRRDPELHTNYRNGYYYRDLDTQLGPIRGLRVPRPRQGGARYRVLQRYARRAPWVNQLAREMFVAGVSTRRVARLLAALVGASVSASAVSRSAAELDQQVRAWHARRFDDQHFRYLILDGVSLRKRGACGLVKCIALSVYGITYQGQREFVDHRLARSEAEAEWVALLEDLRQRGLRADEVELVVTDGGQGLLNALRFVFPRLRLQRCWAHKLRNVANCLRATQRQQCMREAAAIYQASSRRQAIRCFRAWKRKWEPAAPKAVACLEKNLDPLLEFFSLPQAHWKMMRTTNVIERQFREVRRRTNPMTCFAHDRSADRILYAIFSFANQRWAQSPLKEFTHKS
jgi:putative transposase